MARSSTSGSNDITWLITGGVGFLGINLIRHLLKSDQQVISLDISDLDYPERNQITEIRGDIRGQGKVYNDMLQMAQMPDSVLP